MKVSPTTDRGRATVGRVLEAACDLFGTQGMQSTSLDEIGAAAGVGRGQLYHFFVDKADLVAEAVAYQVDRVVAAFAPTLNAMSTADDVYAWCDDVVGFYAASSESIRCPIGSLIYQLGENDEAARAALRTGFARWQSSLEAGLRRVANVGGLTKDTDAHTLAAALLAAYQGGVLLASVSGDVGPLRHALHGVIHGALSSAPASGGPGRARTS